MSICTEKAQPFRDPLRVGTCRLWLGRSIPFWPLDFRRGRWYNKYLRCLGTSLCLQSGSALKDIILRTLTFKHSYRFEDTTLCQFLLLKVYIRVWYFLRGRPKTKTCYLHFALFTVFEVSAQQPIFLFDIFNLLSGLISLLSNLIMLIRNLWQDKYQSGYLESFELIL